MIDNQATLIEFKADLAAFAKEMNVEFGTVVKKVAFDLLGKIVARTPVRSGRARGSWIVSLDSPSEDMLPEGEYSAYQEATGAANQAQSVAQGELADLAANPYRQIFIVNNLPYVEKLNGGSSVQAPASFVELSVAEVEAEIEGLLQST